MTGLSPRQQWRVFRNVLKQPVTAESVEAFAEQFGELSRRDGGIGAWLVQPRKNAGTYSEIAGPAGFHTDSQYHNHPERLFVLAKSGHGSVKNFSISLEVELELVMRTVAFLIKIGLLEKASV